jgi:hypothetical protein
MKITMNLQKLHRQDLVAIRNHNARTDGGHAEPSSVLPKHLWLGVNSSKEYPGVIERALSLAKRKDAVIVQSFVFQAGKQSDWRNEDGTPKKPPPADVHKFFRECIKFIKEKFGSDNLARFDAHFDESSPHLSVWVTPIDTSGKLAQKSFINGAKSMTIFRREWEEKILSAFKNDDVSLEVGEKGGGGKPHDPDKSTVLDDYLSSFPEPIEYEVITKKRSAFTKQESSRIFAVPVSELARWKSATMIQATRLLDQAYAIQANVDENRYRVERDLKALKKAQAELTAKTLATPLPGAEIDHVVGLDQSPEPLPEHSKRLDSFQTPL